MLPWASLPLLGKLPLAFLGTSSLLIELYTRLPQQILYGSSPNLLPEVNITNDNIFLLFHGAGGTDLNTDYIIDSAKTTLNKNDYYIEAYNWKKWCGNLFRAAYDSENTGKRIGKQLATLNAKRPITKQFKTLHTVGVSVGAFAANACINEYKLESEKLLKKKQQRQVNEKLSSSASTSKTTTLTNQKGGQTKSASSSSLTTTTKSNANSKGNSGNINTPTTTTGSTYCKLTLLDPFTSRGIYQAQYGMNEFGKYADFCEQYLNSDDVVPFTNDPLKYAYCYDITGCKLREKFIPLIGDNMHSWPAAYYGQKKWQSKDQLKSMKNSNSYNILSGKFSHDALARGTVVNVL